jgi:hypothetical protein
MTFYKKPEIKEELFKANPLVDSSFKIVVNKLTDTKAFQNEDGILIHKEFEMEKENVTKVYTKPEYRQLISQLSPKAKSLFLWLIYEADSGKDYIWVNKQRYMKENDRPLEIPGRPRGPHPAPRVREASPKRPGEGAGGGPSSVHSEREEQVGHGPR